MLYFIIYISLLYLKLASIYATVNQRLATDEGFQSSNPQSWSALPQEASRRYPLKKRGCQIIMHHAKRRLNPVINVNDAHKRNLEIVIVILLF